MTTAHEVVPERSLRPHRDLLQFYRSRQQRAEFVRQLFDDTAPYYDRISSVLSFGSCKRYRRIALHRSGLRPGMRLLDVATGTGLAAAAALALGLAPADIVGVDPSLGMLRENHRRRQVPLVQACGEHLPFADASFDFISMGYALRHVEDLSELFREFSRVVKPGGRILVLELNRPRSRLGVVLMRFYLNRFLPAAFQLITRNQNTSRLLQFYWATIAECVPPATILAALEGSGLTHVHRHQTGPLLSDYQAQKPA